MNCDAFRAALSRYFHADDPAVLGQSYVEHARGCPACARLQDVAARLSCREFVEFLDDYVAGTLAADRKAVFEEHLAICADCGRYLDSYRAAAALSAEALQDAPDVAPEPLPESLLRAILAARGKTPPQG